MFVNPETSLVLPVPDITLYIERRFGPCPVHHTLFLCSLFTQVNNATARVMTNKKAANPYTNGNGVGRAKLWRGDFCQTSSPFYIFVDLHSWSGGLFSEYWRGYKKCKISVAGDPGFVVYFREQK